MDNDDGDSDESLPFKPEPLPRHIAIVMDGNGRWAKKQGKPRIFGHQAGAETVRRVVKACGEWGISHLTLYAFSTENWNRPALEVRALMSLLGNYLRKEVEELDQNNVRLHAIGDIERLPDPAQKELATAIRRLETNTGLNLVLALSYGSRDEITRAVRRIAGKVSRGELEEEEVVEETISSHLDTAGMPELELLIRTAGEMRLSNFLLWQAAYAEYYSTQICWPDFERRDLAEAIKTFQQRTRTFGGIEVEA